MPPVTGVERLDPHSTTVKANATGPTGFTAGQEGNNQLLTVQVFRTASPYIVESLKSRLAQSEERCLGIGRCDIDIWPCSVCASARVSLCTPGKSRHNAEPKRKRGGTIMLRCPDMCPHGFHQATIGIHVFVLCPQILWGAGCEVCTSSSVLALDS